MYLRFLSRALLLSTAPLVLTLAAAASDGVTLLVALLLGRGGRCVEAAASVSVSLPSATFVPLRLLLCMGDVAGALGAKCWQRWSKFSCEELKSCRRRRRNHCNRSSSLR